MGGYAECHRSVLAASRVAGLLLDIDPVITDASESDPRMTDRARPHVVGQYVLDVLPDASGPSEQSAPAASMRRALATGRPDRMPPAGLGDALPAELGGHDQDDVALLALRPHPEDRLRPAEAGPAVLPADLRGDGPADG